MLSALEVCGLNHCTVGEVPKVVQLLGKMVLSQQEGLDSSSRRTAPRGFLSQDLLPFSLLLCVCCVSVYECVVKSNGRKHYLDCYSSIYFEAL